MIQLLTVDMMSVRTSRIRKVPNRFKPEEEIALFDDDFAEEEHDADYDYDDDPSDVSESDDDDEVEVVLEVPGLPGLPGLVKVPWHLVDLTASSDEDSDMADAYESDGTGSDASDQLYKIMSKNDEDDGSYEASSEESAYASGSDSD